jgi:hypothetical protein
MQAGRERKSEFMLELGLGLIVILRLAALFMLIVMIIV